LRVSFSGDGLYLISAEFSGCRPIDMASTPEKIDVEKTKKTAEHVLYMLGGALVPAMIYLGDRMGLYQALSVAGAVTSAELAQRTGCTRWIRE
jgi:hypothetical protein